MAIIYSPDLVFDLYAIVPSVIIQAFWTFAEDFVAGQNRQWEYYVGVALGNAAAATGIPGAAGSMYFVGNAVDLTLLHSPDGGSVRLVLDGVLAAQINTSAPVTSWLVTQLSGLFQGTHRLWIYNDPDPGGTHPDWAWLGIGGISISGTPGYSFGGARMAAITTLSFSVEDAKGQRGTALIRIPASFTHAQVTTFAANLAPVLDAVLGAKILGMSVAYDLTLPGGLKGTADANNDVQESGLFTFAAAGTIYKESQRVPGFKESLFVGTTIDVAAGAGLSYKNAMLAGLDGGGVTVLPCDRYGNDLTALSSAVKTFRKN